MDTHRGESVKKSVSVIREWIDFGRKAAIKREQSNVFELPSVSRLAVFDRKSTKKTRRRVCKFSQWCVKSTNEV